MTCETTEIQKKIKSLAVIITQKISKSCENYRVVAESSSNALNLDHILGRLRV